MTHNLTHANPFASRGLWLSLGISYAILLAYGSFLPFVFNPDPVHIAWRWEVFFSTGPIPTFREIKPSDIIVNILIYMPFGLCWHRARAHKSFAASPWSPLWIAFWGLLFGITVEFGQIHNPYRKPSVIDFLCNSLGAGLGGLIGRLSMTRDNDHPGRIAKFVGNSPASSLLALALLVPLFEVLFPYRLVTNTQRLAVKWKFTQAALWQWPRYWNWFDAVYDSAIIFVVIGYLFWFVAPARRRLCAALASLAAVALCEALKLIVAGRFPQLSHAAMGLAGALTGVFILPRACAPPIVQEHRYKILLGLSAMILVYFEWRPFDWLPRAWLGRKASLIEWPPFGGYFVVDPAIAALDLGKKLAVSAPLGFMLATTFDRFKATGLRTISFGLAIGMLMEAGQFLLRSRTPSLTDVLILTLGVWAGAIALAYYRFAATLKLEAGRSSNRETLHKGTGLDNRQAT